jgi:DNA-binding transcriptional LysR family regulator
MWYSPSLQQLLFLEAVLEEGNIVRAADRLHTTQPTISRSLKALANGLGINLFDKTPHGLKPSSVGRVYGAQIRSSLEQAKLAFDLARYGLPESCDAGYQHTGIYDCALLPFSSSPRQQ